MINDPTSRPKPKPRQQSVKNPSLPPDVTILSSSLLHCQLSSPNATTLHKKWRADKQAGPKPLHQLWIAPFPLLKWKPITVPSRYRRRSWAGAYLQFCTTNCAGSSGQSCTSHGAGASKDGKGGKRAVPPAGSPRSSFLLCSPLKSSDNTRGREDKWTIGNR